jgi:sugar lactone lactonase YvrE
MGDSELPRPPGAGTAVRHARALCGAALTGVLSLSAVEASAAAVAATLETWATTPVNGLEGLDFDAAGTLYVTNAFTHELIRVAPDGTTTVVARLPIAPQVVLVTDSGFLVTGQVREPDFSHPSPGGMTAAAMGALDARVLVLDRSGAVRRSIVGPAGSFFNGMTRFGRDYLIADSSAATIWKLDTARGALEPWLRDRALAPVQGQFPGANGIKYRGDAVYVSNTRGNALYRIVVAGGQAAGAPRLIATLRSPDDFDVAGDGTVYLPSDNQVYAVGPDGTTRPLAGDCRGCDAALLSGDSKWLYLVTHGFGAGAGSGHVYRLSLEGTPPPTPQPALHGPVAAPYRIAATVQDLMRSEVDPSADSLWDSVATITTSDGTVERQPRTDADWDAVRLQALVLVEASNLLAMPGRKISAGYIRAANAQELDSVHMQQRLERDRDAFTAFAGTLGDAGRTMLEAIDARNVQRFFEAGETLDAVCEACHRTFWYPDSKPY